MLDSARYDQKLTKLDAIPHISPAQVEDVPLRICSLRGLLSADLVEPSPIIHPLLYEGDLAMIYGWRGSGKTWFSLGLSYAIASGCPFLGWPCNQPRRVLYLDGEMRASRLKKRLAMIAKGSLEATGKQSHVLENLHILTRDMQAVMLEWPDLACHEGREAISKVIEQVSPDVMVLDNLSAWMRSGKGENDEESWRDVASFLMLQRAQGRSVVVIHHSGKGGQQRGTSKREDILDTVIALKKPSDYDQTDGLRVQLEFEKARNLDGGEVTSLEVQLSTVDNAARFTVTENQTDPISMAHELINDGASRNEIMKALEMNRFQLVRLSKRAEEMGRGFILPDARKSKGRNDD